MTKLPRTKLLKPSAAQATLFRRLDYLERTIAPMVKANWEILPTRREFADYARAHIEYMYSSRGKQFTKASSNTSVSADRLKAPGWPSWLMLGAKYNPNPNVAPKYRNSDGTPRKLEDDFSKIRRWSVK